MVRPGDETTAMSFTIELSPSGHRFEAEPGETVLEAALRAGRSPAFGCANGSCGECRARVLAGEVDRVRFHDYSITAAEKQAGYALLCSVAPRTDVVVESTEAAGVDDIPLQRVRTRVTQVEPASNDYVVVHLKVRRARVLRYLSGQRATVRFENVPPRETWLASCPCDAVNLRFHVRRDLADPFARFVFGALRRGSRAAVEGPTGHFVLDDDSPREHLFLACDLGFAPVESLIEHAINLDLDAPIRLIRVERGSGRSLPYRHNYCRAWADALDGFHYHALDTSDADEPWHVLAARVVETAFGSASSTGGVDAADAYVAGPTGFTDACRGLLLEAGIPEGRVKTDSLD